MILFELAPYLCILFFVVLNGLVIVKAVTNKPKRISCMAELIEKHIWIHHPSSMGTPLADKEYELCFLLENGKKRSFSVGFMVYELVELHESGMLEYQGAELISFKDKIREFHCE